MPEKSHTALEGNQNAISEDPFGIRHLPSDLRLLVLYLVGISRDVIVFVLSFRLIVYVVERIGFGDWLGHEVLRCLIFGSLMMAGIEIRSRRRKRQNG